MKKSFKDKAKEFYGWLQADPAVLLPKIKKLKGDKRDDAGHGSTYYIVSMVTRAFLLVLFAIAFIGILTALFGQQNSALAVVLFCMLMSIRFVDFGYKASHSLLALFLILLVLLISPSLMQAVNPFLGLVINFVSIMIILLATTDRPEMGNAGLYMFGYAFLTGSPFYTFATDGRAIFNAAEFWQRVGMSVAGFVILGLIIILKHRKKNRDRSLLDVIKSYDIHSDKSQWQLQIALCMSLLFFVDMILHYQLHIDVIRFMWVGFACSAMVTAWPPNIKTKFADRASGIVIGSLLYAGVVSIMPASWNWLLGPLSGFCLGLTSSYRTKTIFNCFGGLMMASAIYGVQLSVETRILNNIVGLMVGALFFYAFQFAFTHLRKIIHPVKAKSAN